MKKYLFLLIVVVLGAKSYSQQDPHYTMYMYNMNIVNPAYAGSTKDLSIGLLGREQWVGIKGAPSTYTANIHSSVGKGLGLGFSMITDKIGPQSENNFYVDVSYTVPLTSTAKLSLGVKGGGSFYSIRPTNTTQPETQLTDPFSEFFPNFGAGVFYHTEIFYLGISTPNILRTKHINKDDSNSLADEVDHYFVTSGYVFERSSNLKIKPSVMFKVVPGSPVSVDLSLNAMFHDKFELGVSHRLEDSVSGTVNFLATDKLRLGYAYDHTLSELSEFSRGSHEFMILYKIPLTERNIKSPRFF